METKEASSADD
jgi:hypothetical protein